MFLAKFKFIKKSSRGKSLRVKETVYTKGKEESAWKRIEGREGNIQRIEVEDIKELKSNAEAMLDNLPSQPKET